MKRKKKDSFKAQQNNSASNIQSGMIEIKNLFFVLLYIAPKLKVCFNLRDSTILRILKLACWMTLMLNSIFIEGWCPDNELKQNFLWKFHGQNCKRFEKIRNFNIFIDFFCWNNIKLIYTRPQSFTLCY